MVSPGRLRNFRFLAVSRRNALGRMGNWLRLRAGPWEQDPMALIDFR